MFKGVAAGPLEAYHTVQIFKSSSQSPLYPSHTKDQHLSSYDQVGLSTVKGLTQIIVVGVKAPVLVTTSVAQGFHNVPKLYGEDVRKVERIDGLIGGVKQAGVVSLVPVLIFSIGQETYVI